MSFTLACYRCVQGWDSDAIAEDASTWNRLCVAAQDDCSSAIKPTGIVGIDGGVLQVYFAAVRDSHDVAAPGDCSSAIKPKVQHRPMFLPAIPFLVEPIGCWASTVARLQEARRHSQAR